MKHLLLRQFSCFLLFFVGHLCQAQHQDLLDIIATGGTSEIKQQKIDSFFLANEEAMSPTLLADCYHDVASKWYYDQWWTTGAEKDIQNAIDFTTKALLLKKELPSLEKGSLEKTAFNLGTFHYFKGDYYKALDSFRFLANNGKDSEAIQDAKLELGALYVELGDFYKGIGQFTDMITFYNGPNSKTSKNFNLLDAYIGRAEVYSTIDNQLFNDKIAADLKKVDSLIDRAAQEEIQFKKRRVDQFKGNRFLKIGEYERAIAHHEAVLADSLNLYPDELARVLNSIGFSNMQLKRNEEALIHLEKAIINDENYSSPYENLGDLYLAQNEFEKGLYQYQKAIIYATDKNRKIAYDDLITEQDFELAPDKIQLLSHVVTKANGWLRYYEYDTNNEHLNHALKTFALADKLVDIIRFESTENQSKLFWREKGSSLYMKAVETSYLLDRPQQAYYFMERNKALLLLEDVTNEMAKEITQLPDSIAKREFDLKRSILLAENELQIATATSDGALEELRESIADQKREYDRFTALLTTAFPDYAKLKRKVDVLPYKKFKAHHLSEKEVVLQYILNDQQGYGLMSSPDQTFFFKLENPKELNEKLLELYAQLTDVSSSTEKLSNYKNTAHEVYRSLLPEKVQNTIKGKKLTIVADYLLQQIPFEALVANLEQSTYLIEEVEIRYAYSMSYLDAKKEIIHQPEKELLGLAPINFTTLGLPKLAFSGEEVNQVHEMYSGEMALNEDATKSRLLKNMGDFKILHLSTHADAGAGNNPWIAFSDQKLFLNEIYATKNQADMVVLSGCNTSVGELRKGEGAMSLARGFFHSGAKSVVSSLWTITDKSSKNLMTDFYEGLEKGLTKSAALRKAKIAYIDKFKGTTVSPSFWAGLIVIGDNSPITESAWTNKRWPWMTLGTILVLGAGLLFYRKMNS
ncbi:CHAT domain-containing protein [Aggregatimonas sangjinii]|uniref:CHAT domain-containing protein n=1 Tax=Aggregatimonas sangjinii TaxID=2583587 RepID=A0A5B7SPG4_9FLAO|nr:CHAT domain-containing protein [Aggregatimonas sangjinii]QCW98890.1 CHAT domain-containing protein [Aggregatimonas sangjinii]